MIVLGIDPGIEVTGYGVVAGDGNRLTLITSGRLLLPSQDPFPRRLSRLYRALHELIDQYRPECLALERPFFAKSPKSTLLLGEISGVAILAAAERGLSVHEYTPQEVKGAVTGYGRASKRQVQRMVKVLLALADPPEPFDAADALAVAICHHRRSLQPLCLRG